MSERSFLAGKTERVIEPPMGSLGTSFITILEMLPPDSSEAYLVYADNPQMVG